MTREQIIAGLVDNAADKRALVPKDEPDSIFARDARIMDEAVLLINSLWEENLRLRARSFSSRLWHPYKGKRVKGRKNAKNQSK